jgi:hypothetical protein
MKLRIAALALAASVVAAPVALADGMAGDTQFLIGQRWLDDERWKPLDEPSSFGFETSFGPSSSIARAALGFSVSWDKADVVTPYFDETGDVYDAFLQFSAGFEINPVKKAPVRPYIGAGVLQMYASTGTDWDFFDGDSSFGFYGSLGMYFKVGDHFNMGFDGRIVRGTDIHLAGRDLDADYEQASILIGFSWGGGGGHTSEPPPEPAPEPDDEAP